MMYGGPGVGRLQGRLEPPCTFQSLVDVVLVVEYPFRVIQCGVFQPLSILSDVDGNVVILLLDPVQQPPHPPGHVRVQRGDGR